MGVCSQGGYFRVHRPEETHRQRLRDQPRPSMLLRLVARFQGGGTPVGALVQKMRTWAGEEDNRSQNGLNRRPGAALPSDSQSGRPQWTIHLGNATNILTRRAHLYYEGLSGASLSGHHPLPSLSGRILLLRSPHGGRQGGMIPRTARFLPPRRHLYRQQCPQGL